VSIYSESRIWRGGRTPRKEGARVGKQKKKATENKNKNIWRARAPRPPCKILERQQRPAGRLPLSVARCVYTPPPLSEGPFTRFKTTSPGEDSAAWRVVAGQKVGERRARRCCAPARARAAIKQSPSRDHHNPETNPTPLSLTLPRPRARPTSAFTSKRPPKACVVAPLSRSARLRHGARVAPPRGFRGARPRGAGSSIPVPQRGPMPVFALLRGPGERKKSWGVVVVVVGLFF
jgi:hypothetical protein